MKLVDLAPEALVELDEAAHWYDAQRPGLGADFLAEVDAILARIGKSPSSFPRLADLAESLGVRRALMTRFPYGIVFITLSDGIRVLAVAHLKRRPGYWLSRVI